MDAPHLKTGCHGETIAVKYLKQNGYKILTRNFRTKFGEIDIIALDNDTIAFIEVKTRRSNRYGDPKWAVTYRKKRKISQVALYYLKTTRQNNRKGRFDVVSITFQNNLPVVEIIKNAFEIA
ncbi:MAG: YraN family protein [Deltaproteobacteria bacterium]|nr:YraN family protein [Deltaproteobacteria bacterium]